MKTLNIIDLGTQAYSDTCFLQKEILRGKKICGGDDYLLLVEHPNVFTIGRRGSRENILADEDFLKKSGLKLVETDRGGDITFHGRGQLVAYPIFDLKQHDKDIRLFIKKLERVLAMTIAEYGLAADRKKEYTGLWIDGEKLGFIGVGISNWITFHGISLNANVDLEYFSMIRPCDIKDLKVTSLEKLLTKTADLTILKDKLSKRFCEVFGFEHSRSYSKNAAVA